MPNPWVTERKTKKKEEQNIRGFVSTEKARVSQFLDERFKDQSYVENDF